VGHLHEQLWAVPAAQPGQDFKRQIIKAGLPEIRFHDLRHSCNSILAAEGVDADTRKKILGHSDIRLTQNLYTNVVPASMRQAVEKMGRVLTLPMFPVKTQP
jgi:integrase